MLPITQPPLPGISSYADSGADAQRSASELARRILEDHRHALQSRRPIELTWEKYALWIDGEGDAQWADIWNNERVAIPRTLSQYRVTHNLLRPIVDNAVAYHTTKPLRFIVEARKDTQAQQQAIIDAAVVNFVVRDQQINAKLAQAMYLAMPCGYCPVHGAWREDNSYAPYEPIYLTPDETEGLRMPRKGLVHVWTGNPFDTTFNSGDKRGSITAMRYGRVVPAQRVRDLFGRNDLEGTDRAPSASLFQRVAAKWNDMLGLNQHGSATMISGGKGGEELIALICEEVPPGIESQWPQGRLTVIALPGSAETHRDGAGASGMNAVHLATQPLPAARFSAVNFYSSQRLDDVHGAPWVGPLAQLQRELNDARSEEKEYGKRMLRAPTFVNGDVREDDLRYDGYSIVQIDGESKFVPKVMELPGGPLTALANRIEALKGDMYTIGGYQAASRGEGQAGDPYSKVAFLAEQDDTIHGPINQDFRFSCEALAQVIHACFAQNAHVPWVVENVGDDWEMMGETYVDRTKVSERPPQFKVVSGFGATNELYGRQLLSMVAQRGGDGQPLLSTDDFRRKWPDGSLYDQRSDPKAAQVRRARIGNGIIRQAAQRVYQEAVQKRIFVEGEPLIYSDPRVQQGGQYAAGKVQEIFPTLPTDDPAAHMAATLELNQDETEDPIARVAALFRYQQYQQWQAEIAQHAAAQQGAQMNATAQQQTAQGGGGKPKPGGDPVAQSKEAGVAQPADPMQQAA